MSLARTEQAHALSHYRSEFPIFQRRIYLNTCSLGALSVRSRRLVETFMDEWQDRGASAWYDVWWERLGALRAGYAGVIGASPDEVALHASISTATAVLAGLLDYTRRPKVVTTSLDFPTVAYQWLARRPAGIELEIVESPDGVTVPVEQLAAAIDDRTALVATSHVYFTTGAVQDIRALAAAAHAKGAYCYIDAYQSVGQIPFDVHDTGVDFLSAGGLKWLLGGPGIVFLYVRSDLIRRLTPTVTGWFAHAQQFDFNPRTLRWHEDARRFEQGTPALAAVFAQLGGLEIVLEIGVERIRSVTAMLVEDLIDRAEAAGLAPRVAQDPERRSAIVTIPYGDPPAAVRRLAEEGIVADARPGHVRLSPYFYNLVDDNASAIAAIRE
ncbi:MAG: aminotransferase class V-fold PLP-dependent enzyme [Gemmatimonadales bacterium]|jgi:selenocysteine lyase/cysteine desulfurase|nr:aminotransferase class V-fold PLP-dependent enzyme [Gemmatimonadales bacterium]